jgi:hypothetical protein
MELASKLVTYDGREDTLEILASDIARDIWHCESLDILNYSREEFAYVVSTNGADSFYQQLSFVMCEFLDNNEKPLDEFIESYGYDNNVKQMIISYLEDYEIFKEGRNLDGMSNAYNITLLATYIADEIG